MIILDSYAFTLLEAMNPFFMIVPLVFPWKSPSNITSLRVESAAAIGGTTPECILLPFVMPFQVMYTIERLGRTFNICTTALEPSVGENEANSLVRLPLGTGSAAVISLSLNMLRKRTYERVLRRHAGSIV
jgi:hypothetical protein